MNQLIRSFFITLSVLVLVFCNRNTTVENTVKNIVGKELIIPDSLYCLKGSDLFLSYLDI